MTYKELQQMNYIDSRLKMLNIDIPNDTPPSANYVPSKQVGHLVYISGQICKWNGELKYTGRVGEKYTLEEAKQATELCAKNVVVALKNACGGNLDKVKNCIKMNIYINASDDFKHLAQVADGASDFINLIFEEKGIHARTTTASNTLTADTTAVVEAIFEVAI
jgi:enamine deaminase RidA (YjgF/YER057c/UK114 family)